MMKKLITLLLSFTLVFVVVACGGNNTTSMPTPESRDPTSNFGEFRWPRSDIATLLPVPKSTFGEILWEQSYGFVIHVGETSKSDFINYIDECWDRGFTIDYTRGDTVYWADNIDGHHVNIWYDDEFNFMTIRIDAAKEDESESISEPTMDLQPDENGDNGENKDENEDEKDIEEPVVSSVDWKEFLRLYEEWMDKYIELLEKYNANPTDLTILNDYLEMMIELAEWAEMAEQVEVDLANDPNALKEYLETLTRIILKLSEV